MTCPHCSTSTPQPEKTVGDSSSLATGDLFFCGNCAGLSVVVDPATARPITADEFLSLTEQERKDISFAARQCLLHARQRGMTYELPSYLR